MSSILIYSPLEFLRLTLLYPCSVSHFRCLELLFQATPTDKEQGDLDSQFSSVVVVASFPCVLAHQEI